MSAVGPGRKMQSKAAKPVDKLTKPELLALCKRLHKRIERLEAQLAAWDGECLQTAQAERLNQAHAEAQGITPFGAGDDGVVRKWAPPWQTALTNAFEGSK